MKKLALLFAFLTIVSSAAAQSLKPENPYAMAAGINKGTSDSLVGSHYWYFYATPGSNRLTVRLKTPTTLYGAQPRTVVTVTLYDANRTFRITKTVSTQINAQEATFTADKVGKRMKVIVRIDPPNQNLLRMGGEYEVEASGDVAFDDSKSSGDPIVRTYDSMNNSYGAVRFLADGRVIASDGSQGTWKAFDPENRIYTVEIGQFRWSVQYAPGYGLVKPSEPNLILFQELRR
jgi:hypothetical protein